MKRISSRSTAFHKKVFPAFWFGFLGLFLTVAVIQNAAGKADWMFVIVPCAMGVLGYVVMKHLVWDLMDEVYDCGDFLLIKNRGQEVQVPLADIMNISSWGSMNPPRITLRLTNASAAGPFGAEIAFSADKPFTLNPFAKIPIVEDLIVRVDRARSKRAF